MSTTGTAPSKPAPDGASRGLEGVVVARTELSDVNGQLGKLTVRGYDIEELAGHATFEEMAYLLWQQMLHQVNHGTQHRSEVAVILTEYGHSPGWMDFIVYLDSFKK